MPAYQIREVQSRQELLQFVLFPDELYKDCPQYVPALHSDQIKSLTRVAPLKYCSHKLWLALDGDKIIGTSGMSFVEKPPYFGCPSGKLGLLSSMFTNPDYRRKGIAKELLRRVVEEARAYGCGAVQITASDMGVKLYTAYGFVHNGNFMQYKL